MAEIASFTGESNASPAVLPKSLQAEGFHIIIVFDAMVLWWYLKKQKVKVVFHHLADNNSLLTRFSNSNS